MKWNIHGEIKELNDKELEKEFSLLKDIPKSWGPLTRESVAKLPKWKQKRIIDGLGKVEEKKYIFPKNSLSSTSINGKDNLWDNGIIGAQKSEDGLTGVLFIELPGNKAVVLKESGSTAIPEVFASILAEIYGIRAPNSRLIYRASEEGKKIFKSLIDFEIKLTGRYPNVSKLYELFVDDFFVLTEYCENGIDLLNTNMNESLIKIISQGFEKIGELVAFDVLINNIDRLPWPGKKSCNISNLFFSNEIVTAIDNCGCVTSDYQKILESLKELISATLEIEKNPNVVNKAFKDTIGDLFHHGSSTDMYIWPGIGRELTNDEMIRLQDGFIKMLKKIVNIGSVFSELLEEITELISIPLCSKEEWSNSVYSLCRDVSLKNGLKDPVIENKVIKDLKDQIKSGKLLFTHNSWDAYLNNVLPNPNPDSTDGFNSNIIFHNRKLNIWQFIEPWGMISGARKNNGIGENRINIEGIEQIMNCFDFLKK